MSAVSPETPPFVAGASLSREEFLRRWEAMPGVKHAELIRGVVYMPSPLSWSHGKGDNHLSTWLGVYEAATPGVEAANSPTWLMSEHDAPQPDTCLRIVPAYGGQSRDEGVYAAGAPEFAAEVSLSSSSYDLHQKLELYQEAGVQEYVVYLKREQQVRWHQLQAGKFVVLPAPADGISRSKVFPGLWLDAAALLAGDKARILAVLNDGLRTPEHQAFVAELAQRAGKT